ncbi:MAG: tetratricopeptide repeat protein [Alphaproteobacteria bacterium]|nr:MAG: hypothetical protein B6I23_00270 [Rickettsiaceae bacterium 4572_127]
MKKDAEQNALIKEVWDGVREQKVTNFLKAYWKLLLTGFIVFLLTLSGIQFYKNNKISSQLKETALFEKVLTKSSLGESERDAILQTIISTSDYGYQGISALMLADKNLKTGNTKKAIEVLENSSIKNPELQNLILIKLATIKSEKMTFEELEKMLKPIKKGKAFYSTANLLLAFKALDRGKNEIAKDLFSKLENDLNTPFSIKTLASEMKNAL